jgi:hypothetical protein
VKSGIAWISDVHRHLPIVQGGLFAVAVYQGPQLVGVGLTGNPARVWQGTGRVIISRVAVLAGLDHVGSHAAPVCSMIYGALTRASRALGYREVWTYTLPEESGASLRAAGFIDMGLTRAEEWDRPSRRRNAAVRPDAKRRWVRHFGDPVTEKLRIAA